MCKYTIGLDFGTLSGRAVLVRTDTGEVIAQHAKDYAHGVMTCALPDGTRLPANFALQHPQDYLDVLFEIVPAVMQSSGVNSDDVIGLGIDFTASTVLPVDAANEPLCFQPQFENNPHAYVKLWKHHGAAEQALRMTEVAQKRNERFLHNCGGKINAETSLPKFLETLEEAPEVYHAAASFLEAGDYLARKLTGEKVRSQQITGFKVFWDKRNGPPQPDYLKEVNPLFENVVSDKLGGRLVSPGQKAGCLTTEMAARLHLNPGIAVTAAHLDGHAAGPAVGIDAPGKLLLILGTSSGAMICSPKLVEAPGIFGMLEDGLLPGYYCYEAGQTCVGDMFNWFCQKCVPAAYEEEARTKGINIHQLLTEKAAKLQIGESGLIALDWWNGNRSCLADTELTGMMLGMTLSTRPEEMYRALLEASVFGMRRIIDNFEEHGIRISEIHASGGIAKKNTLMMQMYADVTGRKIYIGASNQSPALGSAIYGAVAAGKISGGYDDLAEASARMGKVEEKYYEPVAENAKRYEKLYQEFLILHDYFGKGANDVMKRVLRMRQESI